VDLKEEIARKRAEANRTSTDERNSTPDQSNDISMQDHHDPDAVLLPVSQIEVVAQGRTTFKELEELAEDIKSVGQLQPVVVKQVDAQRYRLVAGERRFRAISQVLKQEKIRATIRRVEESETDTRFVQISENTQRDDYLPLELAAELASLKTETGFTIEQIASRIGKSKGFVSKYINLLNAPDDIKQAIESGAVSATAWFNNKAMVTQQVKDESSGPVPPKVTKRNATLPVSIDIALDFARILQTLSKQKGLAAIDVNLSGKVSKKQLQAILTSRTNEILESL
jgi:ParB/RepB/Spo0J family partition protein